jgi:adenine deaminase
VSGKQLAAYLTAGPATDHECFTLDEAREKLSRGMRIMIREGSTARNMETLLSLVTSETERRCMFVCDDKRPGDLLHQGHLDCVLQKAIRLGLDPVSAIRMVTLNPAESFGLKRRGGIAPGWVADLVAVNDLKELRVTAVWKAGKLVARDGAYLGTRRQDRFQFSGDRLKIPPVSEGQFQIKGGSGTIRVIEMVREQIITRSGTAEISPKDGYLESDPQRDLLKLAVIERHSGRGGMAMAFVKGMGLKKGALASTVAHDSHNIIAVGVDDVSLTSAVGRLVEMGGGQVAVCGKEVVAELPLPVAGLMTQKPAAEVAEAEESLLAAAKALGCSHSDPFMALSFLSLPVIPALRLTDKGLFDVGKFDHVSLFI